MGKAILKTLIALSVVVIAFVLVEFIQVIRNHNLPKGMQGFDLPFLVLVVGGYVLHSFSKNGLFLDDMGFLTPNHSVKAKAGQLTDYNDGKDYPDSYSINRLSLIGLVILYGLIITLVPKGVIVIWGHYICFGLMAVSVIYWIFGVIMLRSPLKGLLRFLIATAVFAFAYLSYALDLFHMTMEHASFDPVMVSLFIAIALAISTLAFRPQNKTARV